jgi:hypothetical protein
MEDTIISAEEAIKLTEASKDNKKKMEEEASMKFLKERIGPAIKKTANSGKNEVSIHINYEDSKNISLNYILNFLKRLGYSVSCESARILDPQFKTTELIIQWGVE